MQHVWKAEDINVASEDASSEGPAYVSLNNDITGSELIIEADGSDGVTDLIDLLVQALNKAKKLKGNINA